VPAWKTTTSFMRFTASSPLIGKALGVFPRVAARAMTTQTAARSSMSSAHWSSRPSITASMIGTMSLLIRNQQRLRLGVAEAAVELQHLDLVALDHQPGIEYSLVRPALGQPWP